MGKVLLKFGGTRVGDCFHAIPLLKKLQDNNIKVDLAHGSYESGAAKLLLHMGLVDKLHSNEFVDGNINTDMNSIKRFIAHIGNKYDNEDNYIAIIEPEELDSSLNGIFSSSNDVGIDLTTVPWATMNIPDVIVGDYTKGSGYIGVQPASISGFKTYNSLYSIDYPANVKSFGFITDNPIPDSIPIHGYSFIDVYEELKTCDMVISTHSSVGVLAHYLGIPQIFIHFWDGGLANLSKRENIVELKAPGKLEIQIAIDELWEKLNIKELV